MSRNNPRENWLEQLKGGAVMNINGLSYEYGIELGQEYITVYDPCDHNKCEVMWIEEFLQGKTIKL